MERRDRDTLWASIDALARADPGGVVATDADGTLWSGDVGEDLFHAFLMDGRVEPPALDALARSAREHHVSDAGSGRDIARRLYDAYIDGRFPEERMCEVMTWCFAGWTAGEVRAFAEGVVEGARVRERLHGEVMAVLEAARAAGIAAYVVSASPVDVVIAAAAHAGFAAQEVVGACAAFDAGGVMLARVDGPIPYASGKVTRLRERIGAGRVVYAAFGDNAFDVALLAQAAIAVAVRPKPRLRALAHEVPGIVELAVERRAASARAR